MSMYRAKKKSISMAVDVVIEKAEVRPPLPQSVEIGEF